MFDLRKMTPKDVYRVLLIINSNPEAYEYIPFMELYTDDEHVISLIDGWRDEPDQLTKLSLGLMLSVYATQFVKSFVEVIGINNNNKPFENFIDGIDFHK